MKRIIRQIKASLHQFANLCRKARTRISRHDVRPNIGTLAVLPPEMILEVMSHLDGASQASFALTCQTFFASYMPPIQSMGAPTRQHLLILLEKDIPSLFYCFHCNKLHFWQLEHWIRCGDSEPFFYVRDIFGCKHHSVWATSEILFPFIVARLIMNRHLLGHDHGLDPGSLRFTDTTSGKCGSQRSKTWDARVIDNELAMACITTMWHKHGDAQALRRFIDDMSHRICSHLVTHVPHFIPPHPWRGYGPSFSKQLDELTEAAPDPDCFAACRGLTKSCPRCMTDYNINIEKRKGEGWEIKIVAYYNLGSLRSPEDWKWQTLVNPRGITAAPRMSRDLAECGPGIVRHKWTTGNDDTILTPRGEWVQLWYFYMDLFTITTTSWP